MSTQRAMPQTPLHRVAPQTNSAYHTESTTDTHNTSNAYEAVASNANNDPTQINGELAPESFLPVYATASIPSPAASPPTAPPLAPSPLTKSAPQVVSLPIHIPSLDGFVFLESSSDPVPYHITSCGFDDIIAVQGHTFALMCMRIACMSADIMRGRMHPDKLKRSLTAPCLRRLETMAALLIDHMRSNPELRARLSYLPVVPHSMSGMLVSAVTFEMSTHLTIGAQHYWSNIVLRQMGCRWVCTYSDIG